MQIQSEAKPYDDINITPMLDLAYVLLVIFIIMTTATVQGQKVNLPKASAAPSLATQTTKAITVANDGKLFLDTLPVSLTELEHRLIQQKALTPEFPVVLRGDAQAIPDHFLRTKGRARRRVRAGARRPVAPSRPFRRGGSRDGAGGCAGR